MRPIETHDVQSKIFGVCMLRPGLRPLSNIHYDKRETSQQHTPRITFVHFAVARNLNKFRRVIVLGSILIKSPGFGQLAGHKRVHRQAYYGAFMDRASTVALDLATLFGCRLQLRVAKFQR